MSLHDIIGWLFSFLIALVAGLILLIVQMVLIGRRVNEVHVLVNSKMSTALSEITRLNAALDQANAEKGKHDV